jgi:hypothetical protein
MHRLLVALLVAVSVAACAEELPRTAPKSEGAAYKSGSGESLLRERTTNQSSSYRMSN